MTVTQLEATGDRIYALDAIAGKLWVIGDARDGALGVLAQRDVSASRLIGARGKRVGFYTSNEGIRIGPSRIGVAELDTDRGTFASVSFPVGSLAFPWKMSALMSEDRVLYSLGEEGLAEFRF